MSLATYLLWIGVALLVALTLCLVYELRSALRRAKNAESERDNLSIARETDSISVEAFRRDRDEALRQKSAQFEAWQAEATNLRADVAALNTMLSQRTAEVLYLRPIASAADALAFGKAEPGEWAALREAIRARKEAGNV